MEVLDPALSSRRQFRPGHGGAGAAASKEGSQPVHPPRSPGPGRCGGALMQSLTSVLEPSSFSGAGDAAGVTVVDVAAEKRV